MKNEFKIRATQNAVALAGPLTIQTVTAALESIRMQLDGRSELGLDLAGVTACDTAGVQLLLAARRAATVAGKRFSVCATAPAVIAAGHAVGLPLDFLPVTPTP